MSNSTNIRDEMNISKSAIEKKEVFPTFQNLKANNENFSIGLNSRPVNINRHISISKGPGGIPLMRDTIIIETEPSIERIYYILGIMLIHAIILQSIMIIWNKYHKKSCEVFTNLIMILFPFILALIFKKFFFIVLWLIYFFVMGYVSYLAIRIPIRETTPRKVYIFFRSVFMFLYSGITISKVGIILSFILNYSFGLGLSFYLFTIFVYFSLLTRELIKTLSGYMAVNTGYYSEKGAPKRILRDNICLICTEKLENEILELTCSHSFHSPCIKGWSFMAKREFCPICRENICIKNMITDVWMKGEMYFNIYLDTMKTFIILANFILFSSFYFARI